jgi:hypothetical protein
MLDQISKTVGHGMVSVIISIVIFILVCVIWTRIIFSFMILQCVIHHAVA